MFHVARGLRTLLRLWPTERSGANVKGVLSGGAEQAMLLSPVIDIREVSGRAFIHKHRLALNVVRAPDEDSESPCKGLRRTGIAAELPVDLLVTAIIGLIIALLEKPPR